VKTLNYMNRILLGSISPKTRLFLRGKSCIVCIRQSNIPAGFFKLSGHQRYVIFSHFFKAEMSGIQSHPAATS